MSPLTALCRGTGRPGRGRPLRVMRRARRVEPRSPKRRSVLLRQTEPGAGLPGRVSKSLVKSPPTHRQTPREGEGGAQQEDRTRASKKTASCDFPRARGEETHVTSAAVAPGVKHRGTRGRGRGCSFGTIVKTERGAGSLQTDSCAPAWHVSSQWQSGGTPRKGRKGGPLGRSM